MGAMAASHGAILRGLGRRDPRRYRFLAACEAPSASRPRRPASRGRWNTRRGGASRRARADGARP